MRRPFYLTSLQRKRDRCVVACTTAPLTNSRPIPGKGDNSAACDITIRSVADLLCVQDHTRAGLRSFLSLMRGTINVCFCPLAWPLRFEICHDFAWSARVEKEAAASLGKRKSRSGWVAAALRWRSSGNAWGRRLDDHFNDCTCTKYLQRVKMHLCLAPVSIQVAV